MQFSVRMLNKTSNYSSQSTIANINYGNVIGIVRITLVLLSRGGFILIQSGSVPTEYYYHLLLQNIVEFAVTTGSYGLVGVLLSFTSKSYHGFFGYGAWNYDQMDCDITFGFSVTIIGAAIITTMLAGRLHFIGYVFIAFVYAGFSQPIIMHWMWHSKAWMNDFTMLNTVVTMQDYAGAVPVHVSGGIVGIIGIAFLGRRLLKLTDIDEASLGPESPNTVTLGYLLLVNGLIGLALPYNKNEMLYGNNLSVIIVNSLLALSGGIAASVVVEFILWRNIFNYWVLLRLLQGGISGLVLISSSINFCRPPLSFAVALIGGVIINCASKIIYATAVEDYCNILTVHLLCGLWSPFLQPLLTRTKPLNPIDFLWQIACTAIIATSVFMVFIAVFLLLCCSGFLRNRYEENCHRRSLKVINGSRECPLSRLFAAKCNDDMLEPGTAGKTPDYSVHKADVYKLRVKEGVRSQLEKSEPKIKKTESSPTKMPFNIATKMLPKSKNIYTVRKIATVGENTIASEQPLCSGDVANDANVYKLEDLISSSTQVLDSNRDRKGWISVKPKVLKKKSHITLSKSKRYIDFSKRKRLRSTGKNKNNALVNIYINRSPQLIAYDKKYNDGIVTYKIPRVLEYISD